MTRRKQARPTDLVASSGGDPAQQGLPTYQGLLDEAVQETFPASDPAAHGKPTGTEPAARPADRKAPRIPKEQIEQAQRGDGHKQGGN